MKKTLLVIAVTLASVLTATATPVLVSSETSLQKILNKHVAGTSINVNTDQVVNDGYWNSDGASAAYLVIELAGYAPNNAFGIYKKGMPTSKQQIFAGSATGFSPKVGFAMPPAWTSFGFYLQNTNVGFTWYSDSSLNAGGGLDHFVAYQGAANATFKKKSFGTNDYAIGIEDLNLGDKDYNDMVVLVQNIKPEAVPEAGATFALLGMGFVGLCALRRKTSAVK